MNNQNNPLYNAFIKVLQSISSIFKFFEQFTLTNNSTIEVKFYECISNNCNDLENYELTTKNVPSLKSLFWGINNSLFDDSPNLTKSYYTIFEFSVEGRITCPQMFTGTQYETNCNYAVKALFDLRNVYSIISHNHRIRNFRYYTGDNVKLYYTFAKFMLNSLTSIDFEKSRIDNLEDDIYTLERDIGITYDYEGQNSDTTDNIGFSVKPKIIVNTFGPFIARTYEFINNIWDGYYPYGGRLISVMHNPNFSFYNNSDISFVSPINSHIKANYRFYFDYEKIIFRTINKNQIFDCNEAAESNLCILKNLNYRLFYPDDNNNGTRPKYKSAKVAFNSLYTINSYITNYVNGYPLSNKVSGDLYPVFPVDIMLLNKFLPVLIFTRSKTYNNNNNDWTFYGSLLLYPKEINYFPAFTKKVLLEDFEQRSEKHYTSVELYLENIFLTKIAQKIFFRKSGSNKNYYWPLKSVDNDLDEQGTTIFYCGFYGVNDINNTTVKRFISNHSDLEDLHFYNSNNQNNQGDEYIYTSFIIEPNNFVEDWTLYKTNLDQLQPIDEIQFNNKKYYYAFILIINSIPIIYMPFLKRNSNYFENVISEPENYNTIKNKFNTIKYFVPIYYNGYTLPKNRYVKLIGKRDYYLNMFFAVGFEFFEKLEVNGKRYLIPTNIKLDTIDFLSGPEKKIIKKYEDYLKNNVNIEDFIYELNDAGYNFIDPKALRLIITHYDKKYSGIFNGDFNNPNQSEEKEYIFSPGIRMNLEIKNPLRYKTFQALIDRLGI